MKLRLNCDSPDQIRESLFSEDAMNQLTLYHRGLHKDHPAAKWQIVDDKHLCLVDTGEEISDVRLKCSTPGKVLMFTFEGIAGHPRETFRFYFADLMLYFLNFETEQINSMGIYADNSVQWDDEWGGSPAVRT